jgi:amino acid adenylation domain-containing protein
MDVEAKRMATSSRTAKFDLNVWLKEEGEGLVGEMEYSTDLFAASTVQRMNRHYMRLLEAIVENESEEVSRLPLLEEQERRQMVEEWNGTRREYGAEKCVQELFEEQVEKTPTAAAVEYEDGWLSYAELNRRANRLGHYLRGRGVGPDQRVGLFLERGWEMVVALLGVLKSGGAYVPLDPEYPAERLQYMLSDSEPMLVLTQARLRGELRGAVPVLELDRQAGEWLENEEIAESNPEGSEGAHQLAYMIYTSGSTGVPKGVMVEHGGLRNRIAWMQEAYRLQGVDVVLQKTPYAFDVSVWEFLWPLVSGARLVMARPEGHKDAGYLSRLIREKRITVLHFVPSMLGIFLEQLEREQEAEEECRSLRLLVSSGEALPGGLVQRVQRQLPWVELENLYGPTEATVDVTSWQCPREFSGSRVPIGRPIANTQMYILDPHGEPVPVGVTGELYIGGVGVGRGYWKQPELTAERFVPDGFAGSGARMYRTGDLARWQGSGEIEYLGRNDFQVKVRGFRIELGEIEARLAEHPGVCEAVVMAREDTPGDHRLVAYFAAAGTEGLIDPTLLRSHLSDRLPEYMVPAAYVRLKEMPLTPNGKLDRKALRAPNQEAFANQGFEAPHGETETLLAGIWAEVLRLDRVGRHDNFFALGGHSLMAVRLITKIRQRFDVDLPIREVFALPVLSMLADKLLTVQLEQFNEADIAFALSRLQIR